MALESPVPPARWSLPEDPSLEWLQDQAGRLYDAHADPAHPRHAEAVELVGTYDPPYAGPLDLGRAQLVLARSFGFAGWSLLREHLAVVRRWSWAPPAAPPGPEPDLDRMLRLLTLDYAVHDPSALAQGAELLRAHPELASASVAALAVCGRAAELEAVLEDDSGAATRPGGPHGWPPLLHLCLGRLGLVAPDLAGDPVAAAGVLLGAGADPESGFLWHGLVPPFTALTGVLGGGERGEPPHPQSVALAELLLDAGADPHDGQALYNRMLGADDSHLPPLLAHGLGHPHPSTWRDRLGPTYPSAAEVVGDHLCSAAQQGYAERVRLLLERGVDPLRPGSHQVLEGRTAHDLAVRHGHTEVADLLVSAGGSGQVSAPDALVAAALAGDADLVQALLGADPGLAAVAVAGRPDAVRVAAEQHGVAALRLLLETGWGVDDHGPDRRTALHEAALRGDVELCRWLVDHGADRSARDRDFDSTPAGWAAHHGHRDLAAEISP